MLDSLNGFKFIMAFINLIILYVVLRKVLFKPVMAFMENRTKLIEDSIADAKKKKEEAAEMKSAYEVQLKNAKTESKRILDAAAAKAAAQQKAVMDEAKLQAEALLAKAREEIEAERKQMLREVRSEVASIAFAAASKVLESNLDNENNRRLIEQFIDEAGAA